MKLQSETTLKVPYTVKEKYDPLRTKICYYIDDENIPDEIHQRVAYLSSSRKYLMRLVIKGIRFLRNRRMLDDFREWLKEEGGC